MTRSTQQRWQKPPGNSNGKEDRDDAPSCYVPDSDPRNISDLWARVRRHNANMADDEAEYACAMDTSTAHEDMEEWLAKNRKLNDGSSKSPATSTARIDLADFYRSVLLPRRIQIIHDDPDMHTILPFSHFETEHQKPEAGRRKEHYQEIGGLELSNMWLDPTPDLEEEIIEEYASKHERGVVEEEYIALAYRYLIKTQPSSRKTPKEQVWLAEAATQLTIKPEGRWEIPPILDDNVDAKSYQWSPLPDVSYYLSLQAFKPGYRKKIWTYCLVKDNLLLCPYLTVGFKRNEESSRKAQNQVASAGAMALYNRFKLKQNALGDRRGELADKETSRNVRHYGLTFEGRTYTFWMMTPKITKAGDWDGMDMRWLIKDMFADDDGNDGLHQFVDYLNEINRWGLEIHGPEVERDIRDYMEICNRRVTLPQK